MNNASGMMGFTLLEVMIAVSIVGILAAFAMPSFTYTIQNNRVKTAASDAHMSMLLARSEAIKLNEDVTITPIAGGWQVSYADDDDTDTDAEILETKDDLPADVGVGCNTDADDALEACSGVTFNRTGRPDGFLELRFTSNAADNIPMRCVSISLSGRPKVETDQDGDASNGCN